MTTAQQLQIAREALEAIKARYEGNYDHPALVKQGALGLSTVADMWDFADRALEQLRTEPAP